MLNRSTGVPPVILGWNSITGGTPVLLLGYACDGIFQGEIGTWVACVDFAGNVFQSEVAFARYDECRRFVYGCRFTQFH